MCFQNMKMAVLMSQAQVASLNLYPVFDGGQNQMPRERCNREICNIVLTLLNGSVQVRNSLDHLHFFLVKAQGGHSSSFNTSSSKSSH